MEGLIDMERKGCESMLHSLWDFQLWPQPWPWPWIFMVKFWKSRILEMGWPIDTERTGCELIECWTHVVTFNFDLIHDLDLGFQSKILKLLYLKNGRVDSLGLKGMSVGYDVGCTLTLGHNAWQIDRLSNGSVWNSYCFQPVGPWMGYSFTDLRGVLSLSERLVLITATTPRDQWVKWVVNDIEG